MNERECGQGNSDLLSVFWFPKVAVMRRQLRYWPPFSLTDMAAPCSADNVSKWVMLVAWVAMRSQEARQGCQYLSVKMAAKLSPPSGQHRNQSGLQTAFFSQLIEVAVVFLVRCPSGAFLENITCFLRFLKNESFAVHLCKAKCRAFDVWTTGRLHIFSESAVFWRFRKDRHWNIKGKS
jgi:hypothetical protein